MVRNSLLGLESVATKTVARPVPKVCSGSHPNHAATQLSSSVRAGEDHYIPKSGLLLTSRISLYVQCCPCDYASKAALHIHPCVCCTADGRGQSRQGSKATKPNQGGHAGSLHASRAQHHQQLLAPAHPSSMLPPASLPHRQPASPQMSDWPTSIASDSPRPRHIQTDDAENQWLGHLRSPESMSAAKHTHRRRPKPKRPQWHDVSIDLSTLQASQTEVASRSERADRPVGSLPAADIPSAMHMSGVSPASPSPPKQHALHEPPWQHKSHSSMQAVPALPPFSEPPPALSAWHENLGQLEQRQRHHQGRSLNNISHAWPTPSQTPPPHASQHAESPRCLPPLHHQPAPAQPAAVAGNGPHAHHQLPSEDPRSAQQVPMQYLRHPYGSGSPGGLHKLHRLLRPITRANPESGHVDPGDPLAGSRLRGRESASVQSSHQDAPGPPAYVRESGFISSASLPDRENAPVQNSHQNSPWPSAHVRESGLLPSASLLPRHLQPLSYSQSAFQQQQGQPELWCEHSEPDIAARPLRQRQQPSGRDHYAESDVASSGIQDESQSRRNPEAAADDLQDVTLRLQQVISHQPVFLVLPMWPSKLSSTAPAGHMHYI